MIEDSDHHIYIDNPEMSYNHLEEFIMAPP